MKLDSIFDAVAIDLGKTAYQVLPAVGQMRRVGEPTGVWARPRGDAGVGLVDERDRRREGVRGGAVHITRDEQPAHVEDRLDLGRHDDRARSKHAKPYD